MEKTILTIEHEVAKPLKLSNLKDFEVELLRRVIEISREAKAAGNFPFGCLLADKNGNILMEQGNCENENDGDCTCHAETKLMSRATRKYSKEEMWEFTMYNCAEPCAMCTGAMYWGNLGRMVYIARESELKRYTGDDIRNPTLNLPSRAVLACGQKPDIKMLGPVIELEADFFKLHENFWNLASEK